MKSYTDIKQSKKLAEMLPVESADCCYFVVKENGEVIPTPGFFDINVLKKEEKFLNEVTFIPCWSLAALLEVMPKPDLYRVSADLWVCATFFKEGSIRGLGETAIDAACDTITKMFGCGYLIKKGGEE
jgi:hypothetical protein